MNKVKLLCTIFTIMVFAAGFSASEESEEAKKKEQQFIDNAVGTYVFTDDDGVRYTLTLKTDMTMTAEANGKMFYGNWHKTYNFEWANFKFSGTDSQEYPKIKFKIDNQTNSPGPIYISNDYYIVNDGFLYGDSFFRIKEHNPDYRLKIKKIN